MDNYRLYEKVAQSGTLKAYTKERTQEERESYWTGYDSLSIIVPQARRGN